MVDASWVSGLLGTAKTYTVIATVIVILVSRPISWKFLRRLQDEFPAIWIQLGRPTFWGLGGMYESPSMISYIDERKYEGLVDPRAIAFFETYRMPVLLGNFAVVVTICFLLLVVLATVLVGVWVILGWLFGF